MLKRGVLPGCSLLLCAALIMAGLTGCRLSEKKVKIGVSFGVGAAVRWENEKTYMEKEAERLGADIEVRLNRTDEPKTQQEDCFEMIDSGIDVLILTPRDATKVGEILSYAKEKKVPVISYARVVLGDKVDLFVGYDSERIGQKMGQYLTEKVYSGDYIVLQGDKGDNNAVLLHSGVMRYIDEMNGKINVILNESVAGWSADEAKRMVKEAVAANNNSVDAILAPNDTLAGACVEALEELGVTKHVAITGMDAELAAVQRIVAGTQDITIYMDLQELANTAVNAAYCMATGQAVDVNAEFDNQYSEKINANLITGQIVTKENLDRILIDSGYLTKEQVYGEG